MARYSNTVRNQYSQTVAGASVYVYTFAGDLADLTDDDDAVLANPLTTDEYGNFYFNADDGLYTLTVHDGGKFIYQMNYVMVGEGPELPADILAALIQSTGASLIGTTTTGRTVQDLLSAFPDLFRKAPFSIANVRCWGDSFAEQPNSHTSSGNSMVKKYATLLGINSPSITATSGYTMADGQTAIFAATIAATDHTIQEFGQNDASRVGTGNQRAKYGDLYRTALASAVWLGTPAGTNKVAAGTTDSGQREVSDPADWSADADMVGAFKTTTSGAAMSFTLTNCRYAVLLYKAKVSATGIMQIKCEGADEQIQVFNTAPESGWVPSNIGQTWTIFARVFDFRAVVPSGVLQVTTSGTGEVSLVGCIGYSGAPLAGPLFGMPDLSRRGPLGNATAAGSQSNVPIVSAILDLALAQAQALGINGVDLPLSSVLTLADLDTDEYHPNETGATAVAAAWYARVRSAQGLPGSRLDLLVQGFIQNAGGQFAAGMPLLLDQAMRIRFGLLGGDGMLLPSDNNQVRVEAGFYVVPLVSGAYDVANALLLTGDGTNCYIQARVGRQVVKAATGNGVSAGPADFRPEDDVTVDSGTSAKQWKRVYVGPSGVLVSGTKVVGAQGNAVADASGGATVDAEARTALNALLARVRAHGLIAT